MGLFERVQVEARSVRPTVLLLTVIAFPFYVAGWVLGVAARAVLFLAAWARSAWAVGFRDGKGPRR